MCVELLERPDLREDAVAVFDLGLPPPADHDPSSDHQNLLAEIPSFPQRGCSLVNIFDDVEHIAEVHNVGRLLRPIRPPRRIPAVAGNVEMPQSLDVFAVPTPEVKHRPGGNEKLVIEQTLEWQGQLSAPNGSLVPQNC